MLPLRAIWPLASQPLRIVVSALLKWEDRPPPSPSTPCFAECFQNSMSSWRWARGMETGTNSARDSTAASVKTVNVHALGPSDSFSSFPRGESFANHVQGCFLQHLLRG